MRNWQFDWPFLQNKLTGNDLIVNTTKKVAKSFHVCQSKPPYKSNILLQNIEINRMSEVKFVQMYITENLIWRAHIRSLCNSLSKTYYMIKSLKNTLSTHNLWKIFIPICNHN
jgi:hypothetical protein